MRTPDFWWRDRQAQGLLPLGLSPLSRLYAAATARRVAQPPRLQAEVPVVCVGNLTAGGAGKTPTVIALVSELAQLGLHPAVVTRGYGGRAAGPILVDPATMDAAEVGDEPLLIAAFAPVVVARDRAAGARLAQDRGAGALVLDDGFQNPAVARDLNLLVVDAATGFGNGRVLPAGPLREPVATGLARADAVLAIGDPAHRATLAARWPELDGIQRLDARLSPLATGMDWSGLRAVAFAGIGRPEKFFATLRTLDVDIAREIPLADHQRFTPALLTRLQREAEAARAQLVTTEKDAVRLPPSFRSAVLTVPVRLEWADPVALADLIARVLRR